MKKAKSKFSRSPRSNVSFPNHDWFRIETYDSYELQKKYHKDLLIKSAERYKKMEKEQRTFNFFLFSFVVFIAAVAWYFLK